jgi:hypothetical protein
MPFAPYAINFSGNGNSSELKDDSLINAVPFAVEPDLFNVEMFVYAFDVAPTVNGP